MNPVAFFVVTNVFPFIGFLISTWLFTVPHREVRLARKRGNVGPINYWAILVMWLNSILWTAYGFACRDFKMFFWVSPAVFTYFYFLLSILVTLSNEYPKDEMFGLEVGMVSGVMALLALAAVQQLIFPEDAKAIYGSIASVSSIIANGFPLLTTYHVIKTKDSSRIHMGIGIAAFTNCLFWELYAIVLEDWNVLASTTGALVLTGFQVLLCFMYERKEENESHMENERIKTQCEPTSIVVTKEVSGDDTEGTLSATPSLESLDPNDGAGSDSDEEMGLPGCVPVTETTIVNLYDVIDNLAPQRT